ncbi:hypothetical protein, variant 6 [Aphanomyces invadans]|uniref:Uncharacterized protein n=1 Tax=Aphanomyces invadans TaxID=157072 RepID=A0A024UHD6_9STRA|nr:hypothetical protein, variant 4 [Aphanomyces invadans]XP_008866455.1 hypothetical protein, variant 5 [Aphanomyces invadans]XP_008866456.1 hypothetical protein, variant 6 [Aphanomyces invadans]ETW05017.1 hypothetical protein, variant 4 [Aphanomyces invadans]ETW05018.1 hypothetical protein, variant 5 [Aphanomyces invadans]ETW05019.1 hypothetical protein, variant 6 [Aphanomyces invadans]|eukprot:XP_008866451.1 hypothetical protein, variant 4 [Aphanomyces invadans]
MCEPRSTGKTKSSARLCLLRRQAGKRGFRNEQLHRAILSSRNGALYSWPRSATSSVDQVCCVVHSCVGVLELCLHDGAGWQNFEDVAVVQVLPKLASHGISFEASVTATGLNADRQARLLRCLHVDPAQRSSMQDLVYLLPGTSIKRSGMTKVCERLSALSINAREVGIDVKAGNAVASQALKLNSDHDEK